MNNSYFAQQLQLSRQVATAILMMSVIFLLSACRSGPPPKLYLLDIMPTNVEQRSAYNLPTLGISPVQLPGYVSDARIASINTNGTISLDGDHKWAEEPEQAITRLLIERLRNHTGTTVLTKPWPRDSEPAVRVEVVFDRLLREPLGGAEMAGQILLISGDGRKLLRATPFQIVRNGRSTKKNVFFTAVSLGIDDIARMVADTLIKTETPS